MLGSSEKGSVIQHWKLGVGQINRKLRAPDDTIVILVDIY